MITGSDQSADESLAPRGEITAFTLGGQDVSVAAVMRAAYFRGELQPQWEELQLKLAAHAWAVENSLEADSQALQARADQFRYDRDLITTEETEAWLDRRRLGSSDFESHTLSSYWGQTLEGKVSPPDDEFDFLDRHKEEQLIAALFLNGSFTGMVRALAWRRASRPADAAGLSALAERIETERENFVSRTGLARNELGAWLESAGESEAWFEETLLLEAAYNQQIESTVTPDSLKRALRSKRLQLMQLDVQEIEFDHEAAAREAILCVRQDGMSMQEVAEESRYPYFEREFLLEELPDEWQMALFSTPEKGLAGPFLEGDLIHLFRVQRKLEPTIENEAVRARLERHVIDAHFAELTAAKGLQSLWIRQRD